MSQFFGLSRLFGLPLCNVLATLLVGVLLYMIYRLSDKKNRSTSFGSKYNQDSFEYFEDGNITACLLMALTRIFFFFLLVKETSSCIGQYFPF